MSQVSKLLDLIKDRVGHISAFHPKRILNDRGKTVRWMSLSMYPLRPGTVNKTETSLNPISGRLPATPISGRGLLTTPLDISRSNGPIFKIQTVFDSTQRDLYF